MIIILITPRIAKYQLKKSACSSRERMWTTCAGRISNQVHNNIYISCEVLMITMYIPRYFNLKIKNKKTSQTK